MPDAAPILIYGFFGVETFFLISGFVILSSAWGRTVREYLSSRAARLYPAFWVCVLLTTVVTGLLPISGGLPFGRIAEGPDVLVNLSMLAEPLNRPLVDTVYWTLWYEFRFYLIVACLVAGGLTDRRATVLGFGWLLAALAMPLFPGAWLTDVVMPDFAPYFIAGMAMCLLRRDRRDPWRWLLLAGCCLVSLHRVEVRILDLKPGFPVPVWPGPVLVVVAYGLLLAIALGATDRLRLRLLATAGALTYPFYLLHQRIGYSLIRTVKLETGWDAGVLAAGAVLILLAVAWLVHRFVERPLAPVVNAALRGRRKRHVAGRAQLHMGGV